MSELRRTSLYQTHQDAHATLVPFAGWEMPVSYAQGTVKEIEAVRTTAGLFDVSHMGEARVTGDQALEFVQHVTTNDAGKLAPGMAQYSLLLNEAGGIQDDIIVYCHALDNYVIVLNAGCKDADWAWLQAQAYAFPQATLTDESDATALLAVQGQHAADLVIGLADMNVAPIERFTFRSVAIGQIPCILSRTGYTGEDGYEIFCAWDDAPALWHALAQAGAVPAGLGARDVLRLEAAYPLYGHELDAAHNPWASGVGWAVKPKKGSFVGREAALALRNLSPAQTLAGLRMDERAIPREGFAVHALDGTRIGETTSGTYSPTVKAGIALARLEQASATPGTRVEVDIRGRRVKATVVPTPFYRNGV